MYEKQIIFGLGVVPVLWRGSRLERASWPLFEVRGLPVLWRGRDPVSLRLPGFLGL